MIIEGTFVFEEGKRKTKVEIKADIIVDINSKKNPDVSYSDDLLIFPGFIDIHVHAREDVSGKNNYKEDFLSCSEAALNGGVTAFCDMPNNPIPPIDGESYKNKVALLKNAKCDILLYGGVGPETRPFGDHLPYKAFMGPSIGELFYENDQDLLSELPYYKNNQISLHAESAPLLKQNSNKESHHAKRPPEAEIEAVKTALTFVDAVPPLKINFCHISTHQAALAIINAKKRGANVTLEVSPHHLYFNNEENISPLFNVNPPLRDKSETKKLLELFKNGDFDYLATDHAPHTPTEKERGISGLPLLDIYGLFVCWLLEQGVSERVILKSCATNPGRFMESFDKVKRGKIEKEYQASFTILDLNKSTTLTRSDIKSKCGWSPFEGVKMPGRVEAVYYRGKLVKNI